MSKTQKTKKTLVPCHGCGRHAREVDSKVVVWFCHHCFLENGNYNKYRAGIKMTKPLTDIKVHDVVLCADNEKYIITGKGVLVNEDKYFPAKNLVTKKERVIGDYFCVRKTVK